MAEDRAIASLAEACESGETYSAWVRFDALLKRRYVNPTAAGTQADCINFIFKAMQQCAVRHLAADVAGYLAEAVLRALDRYGSSGYPVEVLDRLLDCFTSVASVDFQFDADKVLAGERTGNIAFFGIQFSTQDHAGADSVVAESAAKLSALLPWYACLLRTCETMVCRLAERQGLLLPAHTAAAFGSVGAAAMRFDDRQVACDRADKIQQWTAAAARAAYALVVAMAAAQTYSVAVPPLPELDSDDNNAKKDKTSILRVSFPASLTMATTLVRLQQWATCPITTSPSDTRDLVTKAAKATVLSCCLRGGDSREQSWQAVTMLFDILARSTEDPTRAYDGRRRSDIYGASDFFALTKEEGVRTAQLALDAFLSTPVLSAVAAHRQPDPDSQAPRSREWLAFLSAWLVVMKACVETSSYEKKAHEEAAVAKRRCFIKTYTALCDKFADGPLAELPQLKWVALAEDF